MKQKEKRSGRSLRVRIAGLCNLKRRIVGFSTSCRRFFLTTALHAALILGLTATVYAGQTQIALKRNHDFYISLNSSAGKLVAEKSEYCVLFSRTEGANPIDVYEVFVEFAQQVGKIWESPRKSFLSWNNRSAYCGEVDLGKQYYHPAFYYITVHYTNDSKVKRTCRFFLSMR